MAEQKQKFTEKHAEIWKFVKFMIVGSGSSIVELGVQMLLLYVVFKNLDTPINNGLLVYLHLDSLKILLSYMISTAVGYTIAFILNRKTTFKADSNVALSATLYFIMVIFTILANGWIGNNMNNLFIAWFNWGAEQSAISGLVQKAIGMAIPFLWTYPLNRFVIHRHKKPAEAVEAVEEKTEDTTEE